MFGITTNGQIGSCGEQQDRAARLKQSDLVVKNDPLDPCSDETHQLHEIGIVDRVVCEVALIDM